MRIVKLEQAPSMVFPTSRTTSLMLGPGGVEAERFVVGYVRIKPGGSVPLHAHANEEAYTILQGCGIMRVGAEDQPVEAVCTVHIPPELPHSLSNSGQGDMIMMFVYSPAGLVDHWAEEMAGEQTGPAEPA